MVGEQLVVQCIVRRASERGDPGYTVLAEREPSAIDEFITEKLMEPAWGRAEKSWWVTPDYRGLADAAKLVKDFQSGWHDLVLGKPVEFFALEAGFSTPSAELLGDIAAKIALSGDGIFIGARLLVQFTGIVLGTVSGVPLLANACVSSLTHDLLLR